MNISVEQAKAEVGRASMQLNQALVDTPSAVTDDKRMVFLLTAVHDAQVDYIAALEAVVSEVRDTCLSALSDPDAHYSDIRTYSAYEPYDDILAIVDPPPSDPVRDADFEAWLEYMHTFKFGEGKVFLDWRAFHAQRKAERENAP